MPRLIYFVETKWRLVMRTQISKWGNSLAVRIPATYAKDLELEEGMAFDVALVQGGLLLRPCKKEYTLDELVARITPENLHGETDWGPPVGRESW
jgi:antitoxin MazE